jgi:small subunit ribosomal protein S3
VGQKVHPYGFRVGYIFDWQSKWYSKKNYTNFLHEDLNIRKKIEEELKEANVSKIIIERTGQKVRVIIHTARPGIVIGRSGAEIERLKKKLEVLTEQELTLDVVEIRRPELDAKVVSQNIAQQIVKRVSYKRAMKRAVTAALKAGALGVKVMCSGRLAGAEIARSEWYREGRVPLHTIRADIDYGFTEATTTYGQIGVKVWIFKGEIILKEKKLKIEEEEREEEVLEEERVEKEVEEEQKESEEILVNGGIEEDVNA